MKIGDLYQYGLLVHRICCIGYYLDGVGSHVIQSTIPLERGLPSHPEKSPSKGFFCANGLRLTAWL